MMNIRGMLIEGRGVMKKRLAPGIYNVIITYVWVLPFFLINLFRYNIFDYIKSYYLYFLVFLVALLAGLVSNLIESKFKIWKRFRYWGKYLLLGIIYTCNIFIILFLYMLLAYFIDFEYFGGCPGGSFGMLFIPSIFAYFIIGFIVTLLVRIYQGIKQKT